MLRVRTAALATVLVLTGGTLASQQRPLTRWEQQARDLLKELVEHNTTQSAGDMTAAAEAMARHMRAAGFPAEDVVVVESGAPKKGNLIVRYRGRNPALKPILLLSHHDVVEANPEDWTLPPFSFIERDGNFFGRGVADDKDEGAIHLTILLRMKAEGYIPERDIIVALTTDEEGGPHNGVQWLLANRPDLIEAEYVINEGGGGVVENGRKLSNAVQASEKVYLNLQFEVTNPGGHSSVPVPDNAIYHLAEALSKLSAHKFPARLNEVTTAYFRRTADLVDAETGAAMRALVANPRDRTAEAMVSRNPANNSRLRTTCVATMLSGGHAANALPQRAGANVNCRILPDDTPENVIATLERVINNPKVSITQVAEVTPSPPSPLTPALFTAIEAVTEEMWPGVPVVPSMSTGATDGLYFRNAGIPVYGVSGLFYENANAHGMNETITTVAFYQGLEFLYRLARRLTGGGVS
jgi:acetylornithine deacetylase/succinyl-diaminopimelate desuccinylase-like protein